MTHRCFYATNRLLQKRQRVNRVHLAQLSTAPTLVPNLPLDLIKPVNYDPNPAQILRDTLRPQSKTIINTNSHRDLLYDLRRHFSNLNLIPKIRILDAFRKHYPDYTVTCTPKSTGLLKLAKAGGATAELDTSVSFYGSRKFKFPDRSDSTTCSEGHLQDVIEFGRYRYVWQDKQFWVYVVEYETGEYDSVKDRYVLYPRSPEDCFDNHRRSRAVDELIAAAAKQRERVEEEVWVYDRGYWGKSRRLWENLRGV
ncbi:MAG: hypothetical protein Q9164_004950, partial [Protoblastenia rupestris]